MNGARYAAQLEMDALDAFGLGGGNGGAGSHHHQQDNASYRGPQSETYDPSAAAGPTTTMAHYTHTIANAPGGHSQTQQHQQQTALPGFPGTGTPDFMQLALLGGGPLNTQLPTFLQRQHTPTRPQYQQHTVISTSPTNPFESFQMQLNANSVANAANLQQPQMAGGFVDPTNVLNLFQGHHSTPNTIPKDSGTASTAEFSSVPAQPEEPSKLQQQIRNEPWLQEIKVTVSSLSLEPLNGVEVVLRLEEKMKDVITKYLPCVEFLVKCQQDLRKGLIQAQQHRKRVGSSQRYFHQNGMSPKQFWTQFVSHLPEAFSQSNRGVMDSTTLSKAVDALEKLRDDAKASAGSTCEAVKNSFLGGMKEGESWGLRKWLSRHGNALAVCTDLECILKALKGLDKSAESTKKLAKLLRPLAERTLKKLKSDVPASYQERSSAHPYLPFFHRLEAALRDVSQFDPEDDGVICLDDSDDDDIVEVAPPPPPQRKKPSKTGRKRKAAPREDPPAAFQPPAQQQQQAVVHPVESPEQPPAQVNDDASSSGSECEVLQDTIVPVGGQEKTGKWKCKNCGETNYSSVSITCSACGEVGEIGESFGMETDSVDNFLGTDFEAQMDRLIGDGSNIYPQKKADEAVSDAEEPTPKPKKRKRAKGPTKAALKLQAQRTSHYWPIPATEEDISDMSDVAQGLAAHVDRLANQFRQNRGQYIRDISGLSEFWEDEQRYADALDLFADVLKHAEAVHFVERVSDDRLHEAGRPLFTHVIKTPLCFRDVANALFFEKEYHNGEDDDMLEYQSGQVTSPETTFKNIERWNMWNGKELLQAVDLVLVNSLAYGKKTEEGRSRHRNRTNELRKLLWNGITKIVNDNGGASNAADKKANVPTRRSEGTGFVVYQIVGSEG